MSPTAIDSTVQSIKEYYIEHNLQDSVFQLRMHHRTATIAMNISWFLYVLSPAKTGNNG